MSEKTHIVVDMIYDFIDGSLACKGAEESIKNCVEFINAHPEQKVLYVCDAHPKEHCSFKENGGIWPTHCIEGSYGGAIHIDFYHNVKNKDNRPDPNTNIFYKGRVQSREEYSGFVAQNNDGKTLASFSGKEIIISGIASEFCIRETSLDFLKIGVQVSILKNAIAYIDYEEHLKNIEDLKSKGVLIIDN